MSPWASKVWTLAAYDCDLYGADVVAAFGEYCWHQKRILAHSPHLATSLRIVSKMVAMIMHRDFSSLVLARKKHGDVQSYYEWLGIKH